MAKAPEVGQGVEELDVEWKTVQVEQSDLACDLQRNFHGNKRAYSYFTAVEAEFQLQLILKVRTRRRA